MSSSNQSGNGIGIGTVLLCIFITLKLTHHIDWSWWWVMSPVWIPLCVAAALLALVGLVKVLP